MPQELPKKDKELIDSFLKRLIDEAPPSLTGVVLFGSLARGDHDKRSDIDFLLVFDEENPKRHMDLVTKMISDLKPHREIRPVFSNLKDVDAAVIKEIIKEGIVLFGKIVLSPEDAALRGYKIIAYDLSKVSSTIRARVARRIYGYESEKKIGEKIKKYRYEGLKERKDCYILGRGVVALPLKDAEGFKEFLKRNGAAFREFDAWL
ncbi:MAG: nucleotidyltransferase domain-containing protein [Candidatus Hydrothermarchaeales archaeon]